MIYIIIFLVMCFPFIIIYLNDKRKVELLREIKLLVDRDCKIYCWLDVKKVNLIEKMIKKGLLKSEFFAFDYDMTTSYKYCIMDLR